MHCSNSVIGRRQALRCTALEVQVETYNVLAATRLIMLIKSCIKRVEVNAVNSVYTSKDFSSEGFDTGVFACAAGNGIGAYQALYILE